MNSSSPFHTQVHCQCTGASSPRPENWTGTGNSSSSAHSTTSANLAGPSTSIENEERHPPFSNSQRLPPISALCNSVDMGMSYWGKRPWPSRVDADGYTSCSSRSPTPAPSTPSSNHSRSASPINTYRHTGGSLGVLERLKLSGPQYQYHSVYTASTNSTRLPSLSGNCGCGCSRSPSQAGQQSYIERGSFTESNSSSQTQVYHHSEQLHSSAERRKYTRHARQSSPIVRAMPESEDSCDSVREKLPVYFRKIRYFTNWDEFVVKPVITPGEWRCVWEGELGKPCGYVSQKPSMKRHIEQTHLKIREYECLWPDPITRKPCGKKVAQNSGAVTHSTTHTHDKPFACELGCHKRFSDAGARHRHHTQKHGHQPRKFNRCKRQ